MTIAAFDSDRMDIWVLRVSIAIPVVAFVGLVLWHLLGRLGGKRLRKRRALRESPEPPAPLELTSEPERLERACQALVESLAEKYLELAECWLRKGQSQRATAAWQQLVQRCPETRQAQVARDRLGQLRAIDKNS